MDLRLYLAILGRRLWVVVATVVVTGLVTAIGTLLAAPSYVASATLRLTPAIPGSVDQPGWDDIQYSDRLINTYRTMLTSEPMLAELARRLGLDKPPEVEVEIPANTELMQISVEHHNPVLAAEAANTLAEMLIALVRAQHVAGGETARETLREQLAQIEAELSQLRQEYDAFLAQGSQDTTQAARQAIELKEGAYAQLLEQYEQLRTRDTLWANGLSVIQPAAVPDAPAGQRAALVIVLGLLVGLVGGLGLAFLFENLDTTLHSTQQIEDATEYAMLGAIPAARQPKPGLLFNGDTPQEEAFRRLRTNILRHCQGSAPETLLITSAEPGEGKSTVAANLGRSLAQSAREVVIVDADLRLPTIHSIFGLPNAIGLSNILLHAASRIKPFREATFPDSA